MKTIVSTFVALALLAGAAATSASAQTYGYSAPTTVQEPSNGR